MRWILFFLLLTLPATAQNEKAEQMVDAAWLGKMPILIRLLSEGVPVNTLTKYGTALEKAAGSRQLEAVRLLLAHGADPNLPGQSGRMPLPEACWDGEVEIARLLLEAGADPNAASDRMSPLFTAVLSGKPEMVRLILDRGARPDPVRAGETPLQRAAFNFPEAVAMLLQAGADADYRVEGETPLLVACSHGNLAAVRLLLKPGTASDAAVQSAAAHGHAAVAEVLLPQARDREAALVALCAAGMTDLALPLIHTPVSAAVLEAAASSRGSDAASRGLVEHLLQHGGAATGPTLMGAVQTSHVETAKLLLDHGAPLEFRNSIGETPFLVAARVGSRPLLAELLSRGADRHARTRAGEDVLEVMAQRLKGYQLHISHLRGMRSYQPRIPQLREEASEYSALKEWVARQL